MKWLVATCVLVYWLCRRKEKEIQRVVTDAERLALMRERNDRLREWMRWQAAGPTFADEWSRRHKASCADQEGGTNGDNL